MSDQRERSDLFCRAVLWLEERGGEEAVLNAFGGTEPLDEIWRLPLPGFKEALRSLVLGALGARRGAA